MFDADHIYALDIETSTETIEFDGDPEYNPGLDPIRGFITEVVVAGSGPALSSVFTGKGTRWYEPEILLGLNSMMRRLPAGLFGTWNGGPFDLPFLHTRAEACGMGADFGLRINHQDGLIPKYSPLPGHGPDVLGLDGRKGHSGVYSGTWRCYDGHHAHLDISYAYKPFADKYGIKHGLKPVCQALGIDMIEVDREKMHLLTDQERRDYVLSDGNGTRFLVLNALGLIDLGTGPLLPNAEMAR